jgi:hypothetical protein
LLQLNDWIQTSNNWQQLDLAFGSNWNREWGWQLLQAWTVGEGLPTIEIVSPDRINGANGAVESTNNKIYISQDLRFGDDFSVFFY